MFGYLCYTATLTLEITQLCEPTQESLSYVQPQRMNGPYKVND